MPSPAVSGPGPPPGPRRSHGKIPLVSPPVGRKIRRKVARLCSSFRRAPWPVPRPRSWLLRAACVCVCVCVCVCACVHVFHVSPPHPTPHHTTPCPAPPCPFPPHHAIPHHYTMPGHKHNAHLTSQHCQVLSTSYQGAASSSHLRPVCASAAQQPYAASAPAVDASAPEAHGSCGPRGSN